MKNPEKRLTVFCRNVAFLRKSNDLTYSQMAEKVGVTRRSIVLLEQGAVPKRLSCEIVFNICSEFYINVNDIFEKQLS